MKILCAGKDNFLIKGFAKASHGVHRLEKVSADKCDNIHIISDIFAKKKYDAVIFNMYDGFSVDAVSKDDLMRFRNVQYAAIRNGIKKLLLLINPADLYPDGNVRYADESRAEQLPPIGTSANAYLMTSWASYDGVSNILRFYYVYGEGCKSDDMLTKIINGGLGKRGAVNTGIDMNISAIYLRDAYKIINKFLTNDYPNGSYNIASDEVFSFYDAATKTVALANKYEKEYTVNFKSFDKATFTCRTQKLTETIGEFKFTALGTGISRIYKDYYEASKQSENAETQAAGSELFDGDESAAADETDSLETDEGVETDAETPETDN